MRFSKRNSIRRGFAILLLAVMPTYAFAVPETPEGWRLLDLITDGSTSDCIGDPKTPLCAAETYNACFMGSYEPLCRAVGVDFAKDLGAFPVGPIIGRLYFLAYRVLEEVPLRPEDIPQTYPKFGDRSWQPGDTVLRFAWQTCQPDLQCLKEKDKSSNWFDKISCRRLESCADFLPFEVIQIFRKTGDHWSLIGDYRREDLPPSFLKR